MAARLGAPDGHETGSDILVELLGIELWPLWVNFSCNAFLPQLDAPEGWTQNHPADRGSYPGEASSLLGHFPLDTEDLGMLPKAQITIRIV